MADVKTETSAERLRGFYAIAEGDRVRWEKNGATGVVTRRSEPEEDDELEVLLDDQHRSHAANRWGYVYFNTFSYRELVRE